MERINCLNNIISNRSRILCRLPIYRTIVNRRFCTRSSILVAQQHHIRNQTCGFKSSSWIYGNIQKFLTKPTTRDKIQKTRTSVLQTNVTNVTGSTSSQMQQPVQIMTAKKLPKFINESVKIVKSQSDGDAILREEPLLFIPDRFRANLANDPHLMTTFMESFKNFLHLNPHRASVVQPKDEPNNFLEADIALQKEYEAIEQNNYHIQRSITESLKCYINACISEGLTERAFSVLKSARSTNSFRKRKFMIKDPELYADLMAKYSMMGNWNRVKEIYDILVADKIPITAQVYMNILDCLGRKEEERFDSVKRSRKYIREAEENNISLNDIMDKSIFVCDQRHYTLKAIHLVHPEFTPVYSPPQLLYSNKLLDPLNENILDITVTPSQLIELDQEHLISRSKEGFSADELNERASEQVSNEADGNVIVKNVTMLDETFLTNNVQLRREMVDKLVAKWRKDIAEALRKKLNVLHHKMYTQSTKTMTVYPYMRLLTPDQYTDILIDELKYMSNNCEIYSPTVVSIYGRLGTQVMEKYQFKLRENNGVNEKIRTLHKEYREILCSGKCPDNPRQLWQRIIHHSRDTGPCIFQRDIVWPWGVRCDVGRNLFKILLDSIKIDADMLDRKSNRENLVPVVYSIFRKRDCMSREEVRAHPTFVRLMRESKQDTMKFRVNEVPMLCPPMPWTSADSGGYLHSSAALLRLPQQFSIQNDMIREVPPQQLYPPLDAVNQLGSIPWRVNTRILDLAIKVFNFGGDNKLDVPLTPDNMLTDEHLKYRGISRKKLEKNRDSMQREEYQQRQNELLSMYTDTLYKLSLANHFRDRAFWLPTNMDFRGRSYPVPPHLTHLSADLTRSMLCFHQKQPLGESGLDWLKLHCINLTGLKKRESIQTRLDYANEIIDDILDSADKPLDGRQWWLESDDPWQTLAACMEIADAIRSPNPAEFMSGFPIHQDGSCNGLQHYAALGRDVGGAASVNLAPSDVPQDVYSTIANRVEELRQTDAANGVEVAMQLDGLIKRKIVKQTVMTTVYGVTSFGARLQIRKQLKNIDFPSETLSKASNYLTSQTFNSLSQMFTSAREIQDWLTESARYISRNRMQHVEWTSPLGLPVIQPYVRETKHKSDATVTSVQALPLVVNRVKEKNAFSPNFIHSLDSCHMMLTSLNCEKAGVSFVSVHDCFWTHPSTVPIMNRICREQFILLHSQPILEDLAEHFYQKYEVENDTLPEPLQKGKGKKGIKFEPVPRHEHIFMKLPRKGEFDLNSVLKSTYFFS